MFPTLTHWPSLRQAIALTAVIAATCAAAPAADLPNIILLMGDDHGWDETGYKLVVDGGKKSGRELFDVRADPAERNNLIEDKPDMGEKLEKQLREWQESVLKSLREADY